MGTPITEDKHLYAALNNCAFVSTLPTDPKSQDHAIAKFIDSFVFLMDSAMIGVGVGFDTKGSHLNLHLHRPQPAASPYEIPDTREGWVDSLRLLLSSYLYPGRPQAVFDYSKIRPPGVPLKTFGGQSSGPGPLIDMHRLLEKRFSDKLEKDGERSKVTSRDIVDIMNIIGRCVIAGNIRRVAEIALGEAHDTEFIQLKDYEKNPDRMDYGWVSNNSIYAELGMDYTEVQDSILKNGGEPGLCWLENMRAYGRMIEPPNYRD